jgi:hypothetical protein
MSPGEARALAMAVELRDLLGKLCDLPEHGAGSPIERAWDQMDEVIEALAAFPASDAWETGARDSWTQLQRPEM